MHSARQLPLLEKSTEDAARIDRVASTFTANLRLPVHRWFRYSAGFSAEWAGELISSAMAKEPVRVLDPFAGSGTTLLAAEDLGAEAVGIEAHPFIAKVARAKLASRTDPEQFRRLGARVRQRARMIKGSCEGYPELVQRCFPPETLISLDSLRVAIEVETDDSPATQLIWLALVSILRAVSPVGTAQWQYVLPSKQKRSTPDPGQAFEVACSTFYEDMRVRGRQGSATAALIQGDARNCEGVGDGFSNLVITSPPYPNNYDYADATRLEMSFFREINGWGDLQTSVRRFLVRSCSQHVPERSIDLFETLESPELAPIRNDLSSVCEELATVRVTKGGKKTYHLMIASYFRDLALTWRALRRVTSSPSLVCFVVGDSAPYGVYVPVIPWMGRLAIAAGFSSFRFEKTRDRNIKWKNRKHRVPLQEGRLWIDG